MSRAIAHIDHDALARSLSELEGPFAATDIQSGIERVIMNAAGVFAGSGVGLMLIADDGLTLRYVASSDEVAHGLEIAHEASGEGPCVDAFVCDGIVHTADLAADARWPALRELMREQPVRAVLGLPTRLGTPVGTLNLYCDRPRVWSATEIAALEVYNSLLEERLGNAIIAREHGKIVEQLQFALDSRVPIERAVGLIMGRDDLDGLTAFQALRNEARTSRRRVRAVAEELLAAHARDGLADAGGAPLHG